MTYWEHLVTNSTLLEADGDVWEHLTNPSGEGGVVINSELIKVKKIDDVVVEVESDVVLVEEVKLVEVEVKSDIIYVKELKREVINVVC